jgi:heterodisulfide reductase subunit C2
MITLSGLHHNPLLEEVNKRSGTNVLECYQCGKCVATCPVSGYMDITPRQIMQHVKLGLKDKILEANSTWYCLTCSSCSARCPREIEIPAVMEAVRHMAIEENIYPKSKKVKDIRRFHEIFLDMVSKYGRSFDLRLMAEYNIRTSNFFKDVSLAPKAILKGKISLTYEKTKNKRAIDKMFKMAKELDKK